MELSHTVGWADPGSTGLVTYTWAVWRVGLMMAAGCSLQGRGVKASFADWDIIDKRLQEPLGISENFRAGERVENLFLCLSVRNTAETTEQVID